MNTRRRRSSPTLSSSAALKSGTASSCWDWSSRPSSSCLRSRRLFRRKWSIARCFALAMSQAPGLSGMPDSGHCWSAATRASWASSSARPTSRTIRARPAMILADSILQTASIARWVSVAVTVTHHTIFNPPVQGPRVRPGGARRLGFRGRVDARIRFVYLAKFALTLPDYLEEILGQFDGFFLGLYLEDSEAADELFGLGERTVCHGMLAVGKANACSQCARQATFSTNQPASFHTFFHQLAHLGHFLL